MGVFSIVGWVKLLRDPTWLAPLVECWVALRRLTQPTILLVLIALFAISPARAVEPDEILPDARMEARARALSADLRCLVCQNQSIDDSNAPLARDLRLLVRERLKAGDSDDAVMRFVVARYGEFVLLRPPFQASTLVLWLAPPALLLATLVGLLIKSRRERLAREALAASTKPAQATLTREEEARLKTLMGRDTTS